MITPEERLPRTHRRIPIHAEGSTGPAVRLPAQEMVPAHLLDGGEIVHFAIKPSPWFVLLVSTKWLALAVMLAVLTATDVVTTSYRPYVLQGAVLLACVRLGWATLEWVSRLYVLTNRRAMSIRGVSAVGIFECALDRIQQTHLAFSVGERVARAGTITFHTAPTTGMGAGVGSWEMVSKPLEVHEKLREAISRVRNRGGNGG